MRTVVAIALHVVLAMVAWLGWILVDWAGVDERAVLACAGVAAQISGAAFFVTRRWKFVVAPAIVTFLFITLTIVDVSPVQPAVRAVKRIQVGMTERQVRYILNEEFPRRLRPAGMNRPLQDGWINFVLGTGTRYNSAVVHVQFAGGRVKSAKFLAD